MPSAEAIRVMSARDTARAVRGGLAAEAVTAAFADRIAEREPAVGAWTFFDRGRALAEARAADTQGPLAGITFGVKDVIDTADMPTTYGSALYPDVRPAWDAPCVAQVRALGGVILGKTVATEFAMSSPGKTRNPANPGHTPGGSSSGSCAAVGAGMVQVAFGTQTSGSLIRPASYCGVVGYKPSFGLLNRTAIKVLSDSLDTLGLVTRDVRDAAFVAAAMAEKSDLEVPQDVPRPRIGLCRTSRWELAGAATREALARASAALSDAGVEVVDVPVPDWFDDLFAWHGAIMGWEAPRSLPFEYLRHADRISSVTRAFLDELARATREQYEAALRACRNRRERLDTLLGDCDVLLTPAATGEAPAGLAATGDPVFNRAWTLLHGPCISVPAGEGPGGLPVGVQLVARLDDDAGLLAAAAFVEDALAAASAGEQGSRAARISIN